MKRKTCLMALLSCCLGYVCAQNPSAVPEGSFVVSYSNNIPVSEAKEMFFTRDVELSPCLYLKPDLQLAGSTVTHIEPCLLIEEGKKVPGKVVIVSAKTKNILYSQEVEGFARGYNLIKLEKPYEIKEGEELLVGYTIKLTQQPSGYTERYLAVNQNEDVPHAHEATAYLEGGRLYYSDGFVKQGVWVMNVICTPKKGVSANNRILFEGFEPAAPYVTKKGEELLFTTIVHNLGGNEVNSLTYELSGFSEKPIVNTVTDKEDPKYRFPVGIRRELTFKVGIEESGAYTFRLAKVNGQDNTLTGLKGEGTVMLFDEAMKKKFPKRQPLVEYFAGEWVPTMGRGEDYLDEVAEKMAEQRITYNLYAIHVGYPDPGFFDPFEIPAGALIHSRSDKNKIFPSVALDRIPYKGALAFSTSELESRLEQVFGDTYSFWNFDLRVEMDKQDPKKMTAYVEIKELAKLNFKDLVFSLSLVEDKVKPVKQDNPRDGYLHRNVLRASLNGESGEPLVMKDGTFRKEYTFTVDKLYSNDIKNIKVVAVIARPITNEAITSRGVLDSRMVSYGQFTTSVDCPTSPALSHYKVCVDDGLITVNGEYDSIEVYDLKGQRVGLRPASSGVYVVRIAHDGIFYTEKVIVQ